MQLKFSTISEHNIIKILQLILQGFYMQVLDSGTVRISLHLSALLCGPADRTNNPFLIENFLKVLLKSNAGNKFSSMSLSKQTIISLPQQTSVT